MTTARATNYTSQGAAQNVKMRDFHRTAAERVWGINARNSNGRFGVNNLIASGQKKTLREIFEKNHKKHNSENYDV